MHYDGKVLVVSREQLQPQPEAKKPNPSLCVILQLFPPPGDTPSTALLPSSERVEEVLGRHYGKCDTRILNHSREIRWSNSFRSDRREDETSPFCAT
mmetsp:Transcript_13827/g.30036  ORF Transcript_13827/g.30036 Transcript_13827/m.30036 type:complete len:97 (+) Transcript_13827:1097-1387(+)